MAKISKLVKNLIQYSQNCKRLLKNYKLQKSSLKKYQKTDKKPKEARWATSSQALVKV